MTIDADPALDVAARPCLRSGYQVPANGASRRMTLDEGLMFPWRVVAAFDDPARLRDQALPDAFSLVVGAEPRSFRAGRSALTGSALGVNRPVGGAP